MNSREVILSISLGDENIRERGAGSRETMAVCSY